jgi:hypothetical protein
MLEKFREIRDEIEHKLLDWLKHQEAELAKLGEERQRERMERLRSARLARELRSDLVEVPGPIRRSHPTPPRAVLVASGYVV